MCQRPTGVLPVAPVDTCTTRTTCPWSTSNSTCFDLSTSMWCPYRYRGRGACADWSRRQTSRRDAAGSRQAVHLLEGEHRVGGVVRVEAVDSAQEVVELGEPALENAHARPVGAICQVGQEDVRADRLLAADEGAGRGRGDADDVARDALRAQVDDRAAAEVLRGQLVARPPDAHVERSRAPRPENGAHDERPAEHSRARHGHVQPGANGDRDRVRRDRLEAGAVGGRSALAYADDEASLLVQLGRAHGRVAGIERDRSASESRDHPSPEGRAAPVGADLRAVERELGGRDDDARLGGLAAGVGRGHRRGEPAGPELVLYERAVRGRAVPEVPVVRRGVTARRERHRERRCSQRRARLDADDRLRVRGCGPDEEDGQSWSDAPHCQKANSRCRRSARRR